MITRLPWFPFYGRDFFGDEKVKLFTLRQIGIYMSLLWHQWEHGSIPSASECARFPMMQGDLHQTLVNAQLFDEIAPELAAKFGAVLRASLQLAKSELADVHSYCFRPCQDDSSRFINERLEVIRAEQEEKDQINHDRARKGGRASAESRTQVEPKLNPSPTQDAPESTIQNQNKIQNQIKTQIQNQKQTQNLKTADASKDIAPAVNGVATWDAYQAAYFARYGVNPVRNHAVNSHLKQVAARLGQTESPLVAAFYVTHNKPLYVSARHSTNLLVRDCEGLRTEWATGVRATTSEAKNLELRDNVVGQAERVIANMSKRKDKT